MTMQTRKRTLAAAGIALGMAAPATAAPIELWAQFDLGPPGTFAVISVPLTAGNFGIGSAGGPAASAALLQQVLGSLTGIRIGGIGNAVPSGGGTQSFGFSLSNVQLGTGPAEDFTPLIDSPFGFASFGPGASGLGGNCCSGDPGGSLSLLSLETTPGTLIGFVLSDAFLGDQSARAGEALSFRFEAASGLFDTPDYEGGRVILFGDDGTVTAVPAPASIALFGLGLLGLATLRRRGAG
ncbi:PEP-CTERM sorting domain-containing protein [Roseomonas sp. AR75]|uniref:PEP-CTERM sorting domain-containing protein n=1 Tax=Roseomonas sp. AR75 TaxID=2562311 RepID=UPI00197F18D5|nr:PEP-CTERM sorting domain-containing protein [Roseomonas sp. AR75]